jgi:DNA-binding Lrp family transcriptional regulator
LANVEQLYEVTKEADIVILVSEADIEDFRDLLKNKVLKTKGVKSTVTSIVLTQSKGPETAIGTDHSYEVRVWNI